MLGKLLKYETKAMGRIVLPFYGGLIGAAILLAIFLAINGDAFEGGMRTVLSVFLFVLLVGLFVASAVVCLVLIIQRYYKNLLGNEGYLMFTLPVRTWEHIACKTITAVIWSTVGMLTGTLAVLIIIAGTSSLSEVVRTIAYWFHSMAELGAGNMILLCIEGLLLLLVGEAANISQIYTAISIGHMWSEHRILGAILAYIGIGTALSTITTFAGIVLPVNNIWDWMSVNLDSMPAVHLAIWALILFEAITLAAFSAVSWYMLDRHLNLQ